MKKAFCAAACVMILAVLAGCGGGGGTGSESPYTGLTSAASITENNAENMALQAYEAGEASSFAATPLAPSSAGGAAGTASPRVVGLVRTLEAVTKKISSLAPAPPAPARDGAGPLAAVTVNETIFDGFGGSATIAITVDDQTGDFSGSFTFQNWHGEGGGLISGTATVSGNFDQLAGQFARIRFTFASLTVTDGLASLTLTGTVDLVSMPPSGLATLNLYLRDNATGKTVWIEDYTVETTEGPDVSPFDGFPDFVSVTVSGRVYLHDYGFVDVSTPQPFVYDAESANPSSGILLLTGSLGRKARLVVIDEVTGYYVEADLDADGFYEWVSLDHPWS